MVLNPKVKYTVQDYMALPESETERYELIDGEFVHGPFADFLASEGFNAVVHAYP